MHFDQHFSFVLHEKTCKKNGILGFCKALSLVFSQNSEPISALLCADITITVPARPAGKPNEAGTRLLPLVCVCARKDQCVAVALAPDTALISANERAEL